MSEPNTDETRNWWQQRSRRAKATIIGAALVVVVIAAGSGEPTKPDAAKAAAKRPAPQDTPAKPLTPVQELERDVRKNLRDQYGKNAVKAVECSSTKADPMACIVDVRVHAFRDQDGLVREMGGGLHELFRDTDVRYITLNALSDTLDGLGNENKDDQVGFVSISKAGWGKVDWDNLQYQNPIALRDVSDALAITVTF